MTFQADNLKPFLNLLLLNIDSSYFSVMFSSSADTLVFVSFVNVCVFKNVLNDI